MHLDAKIRKQESMLSCSGMGVIIFGIWNIIRALLMEYLDPSGFLNISSIVEEVNENIANEALASGEIVDISEAIPMVTEGLLFSFVMLFLLLDLIIRLYIGMSARMEGRGRLKKRPTYIVISGLYLLLEVYRNISAACKVITGVVSIDDMFFSIADLTTCIAMVLMLISAIKLRKLLKQKKDIATSELITA